MTERLLDIEGVFEKELYICPRLMPVVVAKLNGTKSDLTKIFRATKDLPYNDELKHLRRIRDLPDGDVECVICKYVPKQEKECPKDFLLKIEKTLKAHGLLRDFQLLEVPESAPQTELQRKASLAIWPCKYARSDYLNRCLDCSVFNAKEKLALNVIVNHSLSYIEHSCNETSSIAIIFRGIKIYGVGTTGSREIGQNLTAHACMVAIDQVASGLGGGHWKHLKKASLCEELQSCLNKDERFEGLESYEDSNPYLCTNYDIFMSEEPCFMCLMALIQSRLRRLFYLDEKSSLKVLHHKRICFPDKAIENHRLHRDRRLNHRFEAWRIKLRTGDESSNNRE